MRPAITVAAIVVAIAGEVPDVDFRIGNAGPDQFFELSPASIVHRDCPLTEINF